MEDSVLDRVIDNLALLYILGAQILFKTLENKARTFHLDETLTPEQKRLVKKELHFTSEAIKYLGEAKVGYDKFLSACNKLIDIISPRIGKNMDNRAMSSVNSLLAINITMLAKVFEDPKNEELIDKFIWELNGEPDIDIKKAHNILMTKAGNYNKSDTNTNNGI